MGRGWGGVVFVEGRCGARTSPPPNPPPSRGRAQEVRCSMKRLAVYCGSSPGADPAFADAARAAGAEMARRGIGLVYGGGRLGLMGIVADAVLAGGGEAYGVIPQALIDLEVAHGGLTEIHVVANMHERKAKMTELTDAFVALPGGIGTFDELFEA